MFKLGKRYGEQKNKLIEGFSPEVWESLSPEEKIKHTHSKFKLTYVLFPSKNRGFIKQKKITSAPQENNGPS